MAKALVERTSLAGGEISPALYARRELGVHAIGVSRLENMVVLIEGAATRRSGTRFVLAYKNEAQAAVALRFRHTPADGYLLVLNGGVMRVLKDGGFLESAPGVIYELAIPWAAADLPNLRAQQVDNKVYLTCTGFQTRVLTRGASHIDWTLSLYQPAGGPVKVQNFDEAVTIQASRVSGAVTLTGVGTNFAASDIGGVFRLDESSLSLVPQWAENENLLFPTITFPAGSNIGDMTGGGGLAAAFDANYSTVATKNGTFGYVGRSLTTPSAINRISVACIATGYGLFGGDAVATLELYAKTGGAPVNSTDGTLLDRVSLRDPDVASAVLLVSSDPTTVFAHVWVRVSSAVAGSPLQIAELDWATQASLRRYNGKVYEAVKTTGSVGLWPPTHDQGDFSSGPDGTIWRYRHGAYGFARITAVASATSASATVLKTLPDSVVQQPTYRFWPPAWSPREGWPDRIASGHDGRLIFGRKDELWITRPSDINSLEVLDITGDAADPDSAIAVRIRPRKSELPWIEWILSAGVVILGLRDSERVMRAPQLFDPLTIDKLRALPGSKEGSAAHDPADVDDGIVIIGRSRRRLHFVDFDSLSERMTAAEVTKYARHILAGKASSMAWQRDPNRVLWIACQDGSLIGLTFMPEDKVVAFHRHPMTNGFVEWVASVPSADESEDQVYFGVRRTINGATRRYVELLQPFFVPLNSDQPDASGAWFVDCALPFAFPTATITGATAANPVVVTSAGHPFVNGQSVKISGVVGMTQLNGMIATVANKTANTFELAGVDGTAFTAYVSGGTASQMVTSLTGLDHLIGQSVRVFADGAQQPNLKTVSGAGGIALDQPANAGVVGLPLKWFVRSLPLDLDTPAGSTKGKEKGATHVVIESVYSAGGTVAIHPGKVGVNAGKKEPLTGTGSLDYDAAIPLLTELKRVAVSNKKGPRCLIELEGDNALPYTLAGFHPEIDAEG